ncbi:2-oxoacid:acceptor oxidoreductase family protein [Candidatus Aerophobetes bacterium]|nr:2-oxoacid:acceptor oxidoreductase family protein [Candidatus Aerophobetes bacterium]
MKTITEVRWHGRAGQGAKTAALLLAEAALGEGKYIQGFPEYGPEREGAPIKAYTRISDTPIFIHSGVVNPDAVVVLDETLLDAVDVAEGLPEQGVLVVNTNEEPEVVRKKLGMKNGKIYTINATSISLEILGRNLPNMPMVGALIKALPIFNLDILLAGAKKKFEKKFSSKIVEGNISAIRKAYKEVKSE